MGPFERVSKKSSPPREITKTYDIKIERTNWRRRLLILLSLAVIAPVLGISAYAIFSVFTRSPIEISLKQKCKANSCELDFQGKNVDFLKDALSVGVASASGLCKPNDNLPVSVLSKDRAKATVLLGNAENGSCDILVRMPDGSFTKVYKIESF